MKLIMKVFLYQFKLYIYKFQIHYCLTQYNPGTVYSKFFAKTCVKPSLNPSLLLSGVDGKAHEKAKLAG